MCLYRPASTKIASHKRSGPPPSNHSRERSLLLPSGSNCLLSQRPRSSQQSQTDSLTHEDGIVKWVANGHTAIISHESQQEPLRSHETDKEANLYTTTHKGDGLPARQEVDCHLWRIGTDQHEVHEEELRKKYMGV